jgi:4-amino-4-deoxy-L-arabinose transferase-like glycosyltransferase
MKKITYISPIVLILFFSFISRLIAGLYFADTDLKNEWALLIHNFNISGVYGYNVVLGDYYAIPKFADIGEKVLPSVFMPPLYFFIIYILDLISLNFFNTTKLLIFFQIIINIVSIILIYKITLKFENKFISLLICFLFAFFPLNIYASVQVSSITIQIFLLLGFLFFLQKLLKNKNNKNLFIFSIFSGLLILTRGEFFLFYFFTIIYFFVFNEKKLKTLIISIILTSLVISPYIIRNYMNFDTIVLTKSFGYNLLKGNNPSLKVEGDPIFIEEKFNRQNLKILSDKRYEINLDDYYKGKAINYLLESPIKYIKFYFHKVLSFIFFDVNSSYPNYFNFFHMIPKLIISLISFIGAIVALRKRGFLQYLSIFYFLNIFFFSIFFILPRYSLILLPIKLLLSIYILKKLIRKYFNKFS